jgi:hypothetical protein
MRRTLGALALCLIGLSGSCPRKGTPAPADLVSSREQIEFLAYSSLLDRRAAAYCLETDSAGTSIEPTPRVTEYLRQQGFVILPAAECRQTFPTAFAHDTSLVTLTMPALRKTTATLVLRYFRSCGVARCGDGGSCKVALGKGRWYLMKACELLFIT